MLRHNPRRPALFLCEGDARVDETLALLGVTCTPAFRKIAVPRGDKRFLGQINVQARDRSMVDFVCRGAAFDFRDRVGTIILHQKDSRGRDLEVALRPPRNISIEAEKLRGTSPVLQISKQRLPR